MKKIRAAIIGTGFMGRVHTEAVRRLGNVDVVAVAGITEDEARRFAETYSIPNAAGDYRTLVADPSIDAVHVCTPNVLHHPVSKAFMEAGKHVVCEKPLSMSCQEALDLIETQRRTGVVFALNHNLRYYPVVQQARRMIQNGEIGDVLIVQGTYSQDWLLYDTDYNWRVESKETGPVRAIGDIGSHWMDMIQHLTGMKITALCADLATFHKTRKKPRFAIETFAGKTLRPEDYEEVPIDTDDYAGVLLRLGERARGAYTVTEMAAGCKNRFQWEIYGTKAGLMWNQERPDELWIGQRNSPNQIILKDPALFDPVAATFADLPGGHSEGYDDSHKQLFRRFYRKVADPAAPADFPALEEGHWVMHLLEKALESNAKRAWVETM